MCGRYSLALRPSQIRQMLEDDGMPVDDAPADEGDGAPRQSYNFAPGYHGVVYRADVPDHGAGPARGQPAESSSSNSANQESPSEPASKTGGPKTGGYRLQSMKWGLVPSWTKRTPDYAGVLKTINCRDDSLASPGGLWASMKGRKRCVVLAQGFYEWLKVGREKVPHYVRRKDGRLMCLAGLWDCVRYQDQDGHHQEGEESGEKGGLFTYTIITTGSNPQLKFLHDRMPVILEPGSKEMKVWLDPGRWEWSAELQGLLRPYAGELEVYPVSKEVGKVGNNSPSFIIPVASRENKRNIANFFARGEKKGVTKGEKVKTEGKEEEINTSEDKVEDVKPGEVKPERKKVKAEVELEDDNGQTKTETLDDLSNGPSPKGLLKREASPPGGELPAKKLASPTKFGSPAKVKQGRAKISATSHAARSPVKSKKGDGSLKITKFFGNSA